MVHPSLLTRKIIHVDMDAFYASIEFLDRPELRGKPLVVGGEERGVVAAASYEARVFGIKSAMPMKRALALCPDLVVVRPRFSRYTEVSRLVQAIFFRHTQVVEPLSLDEAYLDVTAACADGTFASALAKTIRQTIHQETGLTASAGVGPNKLIAKIASDICKPNGMKVIPPAAVPAFMHDLPVERIHGVGPVTARQLHANGWRICADLIKAGPLLLKERLGVRTGAWLWHMAHGIDERDVETERERKSVGAETTFARDLTDAQDIAAAIAGLAEEVYQYLVEKRLAAGSLTLKVRYADFTTLTRAMSFPLPVRSCADFREAGLRLLQKVPAQPIRLLGLSLSRLSLQEFEHRRLFPEP